MFDYFSEHPGQLYVVATLLPLASFVLLLLAGAVRWALRANHPAGARAFEHGGEFHTPPGKGAAYVATGAIGLACLLSLIGFVKFTSEAAAVHEEHAGVIHQGGHEHGKEPSKKDKEKQAKKRAAAHSDLQDFEERWSGRMRPDWAVVRPASLGDSDKGTV